MNVLIIGSGGREHAIAWKVAQSPKCNKLFVAPGNAGTSQVARNVHIGVNDFEEIGRFALENEVSLIIVGPEEPLVNGIVDYFKENPELQEIRVFGPDKKGAQLEGSKDFSKEFMFKYGIPTAGYKTFTKEQLNEGLTYLDAAPGPYVLKADGLAAGKGVIITESREEAKQSLTEMLADAKFGAASAKVVIEQFLDGIECSVFVVADGKDYKILPEAKDYKRIGEGDTGLNTGGMGALSPVPFADAAFMSKVEERIIKPTMAGLQAEGIVYQGFIFFGLIKVDGEPMVIEYNCRMGDPETEVVMPRIASDFLMLIDAASRKRIASQEVEFTKEAASTVMLVAGGYPEAYHKGDVISGLGNTQGVLPFHAGTKTDGEHVVTNGGRVIAVSALGEDIFDALSKSYEGAKAISWDKVYYRTDLGFDLK